MGKSKFQEAPALLIKSRLKIWFQKCLSRFLQAIWKSIFISSHSTPVNVALARGTICSSQSLWWRAAAQLAKNIFWAVSLFLFHSPKMIEWQCQCWSQWHWRDVFQAHPGARRHPLLDQQLLSSLGPELLLLPFARTEQQLWKSSCSDSALKCER